MRPVRLRPATSATATRTPNVTTPLRRRSRACIAARSYSRGPGRHVSEQAAKLLQSFVMGDDLVEPLREPPVRGIESVDGSVVVRLGGELDLYNAEEVRTALAD